MQYDSLHPLISPKHVMIVFDILQKTYSIIRNWGDTVTRSKTIVTKTKELTSSGSKLIAEVKKDGIHLDDLAKLKDGGGKLREEAETIVGEVGALGEKMKKQV